MLQTVVAALIQRGGQILICRRRPDQPHALKWEFPGGKVEPGESLAQALHRELAEELGMDARIGGEAGRYQYQYPGKSPIELVFFEVTDFQGELSNHVFQEIRWVERARLAAFDFLEGDVDFVKRLAAGGA
jgi:8-oxo-dGTP diphosphatase